MSGIGTGGFGRYRKQILIAVAILGVVAAASATPSPASAHYINRTGLNLGGLGETIRPLVNDEVMVPYRHTRGSVVEDHAHPAQLYDQLKNAAGMSGAIAPSCGPNLCRQPARE